MSTENYIYLGFQQDTYFFLHVISNINEFNKISYCLDNQIMSCMINNKMIISTDKKIIVYSTDGNVIYANCIHHNRDKKEIYDKNNLAIQLKRCIKTFLSRGDNRKTLIFSYCYSGKVFETYFIDLDVSSLLLPLDNSALAISDINYYTNYKSITS